mgnify:CR=1 FL=1
MDPAELYRTPNALAPHYSRFHVAERLLLTGHSHQAWPDVGFEAQSEAWLDAAMIACILLSWLKFLALDGDLARAEPKTLRYRVLHAGARLVRGGRRRTLMVAATWPWAEEIVTAWQRVQAIPHPT